MSAEAQAHGDGESSPTRAAEVSGYIETALCEIEREAGRLRDRCQRKKWWFRKAHYLGVIAVALAAAASVSALRDILGGTFAALLAGSAAVVGAVQVFLRADENAELHLGRAVDWDALAKSIADLRAIRLPSLAEPEAREELRKCREEFFALRRHDPS